jgi:hypothetical protein
LVIGRKGEFSQRGVRRRYHYKILEVRKRELWNLLVGVQRELFASITESEENERDEMSLAPRKSMRESGELRGVSFNTA